ncbi:MAG: hypothetical protein IKO47_12930 [Ruminococcus sp.]|nr:hypothetical protein [Ruminococcus sp.]
MLNPLFNNSGSHLPVFGPQSTYPRGCGDANNWSGNYCNSTFSWNNAWYTTRQVLSRHSDPEFSARKIIHDDYNGEYKVRERNGRVVVVGKFQIKKVLVVNPRSESEFAAMYFEIEVDAKKYPVVLSYKEYCARDLLSHLPFFKRNPDCPDSYIVAAVYLALQDYPDAQFLSTASRSGFVQYEEGKVDFASSASVFPGLEEYYPPDIRERKLIKTDRALADVTAEYRKFLESYKELIPLVNLRVHAIISRFSCEGAPAEEAYVVIPAGEKSAKVAIVCLKTKSYESTSVCPLLVSKTELRAELDSTNDGVALFRDNSLVESVTKRIPSFDVLMQDLVGADGREKRGWHVISIIEDRPSNIPPGFPALFLALSEQTGEVDVKKLQRLSGEFDAALIRWLVNNTANALAKLRAAVEKIEFYPDHMFDPERVRTIKGLSATAWFLVQLGLYGLDDSNEFTGWLNLQQVQSDSATVEVVNDFRDVVNRLIASGTVKVVGQAGPPYYSSGEFISEDNLISFEVSVLDNLILPLLKTTKRRNVVLSALSEAGLLYANNNYKRIIAVEVAPFKKRSLSVYSVSKDILDEEALDKIAEKELAAFFMRSEQMHHDFMPILRNFSGDKVAGIHITPDSDTVPHEYTCGATRSGKSHRLCQQAVLKAATGEKVLILDHSGGFSLRELRKHLPERTISKYFDSWDINEKGLPVDLMNLDGCETLPEAKNQLLGILSAAIRVGGDVQEKVLRRRLSTFLKERGSEPDAELRDILDYLDCGDPFQKKLFEKLFDVFDSMEGIAPIKNDWEQFFKNSKPIIVVSASDDSVNKSTHLLDMLLASLYSYKQHRPDERLTVVIDEVEDHYIASGSPIDIILRKGGKHGLTLLLASQEFSVDKDNLGKLIGNCKTIVFFRPKNDNLKEIARITGFDTSTLAGLEQGECIAVGNFESTFDGKSKHIALIGRTYVTAEDDEDSSDNEEDDSDNDDSVPDNYVGTTR